MEDKEMNVDLDNLKKEDFIEMAKYIQHLESQVEQLKGYCITLKTQRVNADNKVKELQSTMFLMQPIPRGQNHQQVTIKLDDNVTLINPEQYREKKQF